MRKQGAVKEFSITYVAEMNKHKKTSFEGGLSIDKNLTTCGWVSEVL